TLEAAGAVTEPELLDLEALEGLSALVDKSLVRSIDPAAGFPRFAMLETTRQFGQAARLREAELDRTRGRRGQYFLTLARQAEVQLTGAAAATWLEAWQRAPH